MTSGLRAVILGAAAGGGVPQWNCGCANCEAARAGRIQVMTQSSLAVSAGGGTWALLNASPDIGRQLLATKALHPTGPRRSPIAAVVLTSGEVDHVAGLLTLREKQPFTLWMTEAVAATLAANPIFEALDRQAVERRQVALDEPFGLLDGLTATLFAVPGKVPLYMEGAEDEIDTAAEGGETVGLLLEGGGARAFYIPGCARVTPALARRLGGADTLFFDGTVWSDDELIRLGLGAKTGRRMGHVAMSGPEGSIAALSGLGIGRKVFVHINNSNPVLVPDGPERRIAEAGGWTVAADGMELAL